MKKQFCLTTDTTAPIYKLAENSEELVSKYKTELMVAPGVHGVNVYVSPESELTLASRIIEAKPTVSGFYLLKVLLEQNDCMVFNQSNFSKTNNPVRSFDENFILKKVDMERPSSDLQRVYDLDGLVQKFKRGLPIESLPSYSRNVVGKFFEHLFGKNNLISDIHPNSKLKIAVRENKITTGSFYNSLVYLYKNVGDCELLKPTDIKDIADDQILIRYSFSKNTVYLYCRNAGLNEEYLEILKKLENCGQEDFYIKRDERRLFDFELFAYVEPVIKLIK